jgi:hypothetical protein
VSKQDLLARLAQAGVQLNDLGSRLFSDSRFTTTASRLTIDTAQLSVADLGFPAGATFAELVTAAALRGLSPCELELAPNFRLQFTDQAEGFVGQPATQNQAPTGAITVASLPISEDDEDPKGFYLRRIDGVLWLRGYRSWAGHIWSAGDEFVFVSNAA